MIRVRVLDFGAGSSGGGGGESTTDDGNVAQGDVRGHTEKAPHQKSEQRRRNTQQQQQQQQSQQQQQQQSQQQSQQRHHGRRHLPSVPPSPHTQAQGARPQQQQRHQQRRKQHRHEQMDAPLWQLLIRDPAQPWPAYSPHSHKAEVASALLQVLHPAHTAIAEAAGATTPHLQTSRSLQHQQQPQPTAAAPSEDVGGRVVSVEAKGGLDAHILLASWLAARTSSSGDSHNAPHIVFYDAGSCHACSHLKTLLLCVAHQLDSSANMRELCELNTASLSSRVSQLVRASTSRPIIALSNLDHVCIAEPSAASFTWLPDAGALREAGATLIVAFDSASKGCGKAFRRRFPAANRYKHAGCAIQAAASALVQITRALDGAHRSSTEVASMFAVTKERFFGRLLSRSVHPATCIGYLSLLSATLEYLHWAGADVTRACTRLNTATTMHDLQLLSLQCVVHPSAVMAEGATAGGVDPLVLLGAAAGEQVPRDRWIAKRVLCLLALSRSGLAWGELSHLTAVDEDALTAEVYPHIARFVTGTPATPLLHLCDPSLLIPIAALWLSTPAATAWTPQPHASTAGQTLDPPGAFAGGGGGGSESGSAGSSTHGSVLNLHHHHHRNQQHRRGRKRATTIGGRAGSTSGGGGSGAVLVSATVSSIHHLRTLSSDAVGGGGGNGGADGGGHMSSSLGTGQGHAQTEEEMPTVRATLRRDLWRYFLSLSPTAAESRGRCTMELADLPPRLARAKAMLPDPAHATDNLVLAASQAITGPTLNLDGMDLGQPVLVQELCFALRCNDGLEELSLCNAGLVDETLANVRAALQDKAQLRTLRLDGNAISANATLDLAASLPPNVQVRGLEGWEAVRVIPDVRAGKATEIRFGKRNKIPPNAMQRIIDSIAGNRSLRKICISHQDLTDAMAISLLRNCGGLNLLGQIDLSHNQLTNETVFVLCEVFRNHPRLRIVNLSHNKLRDDSGRVLGALVRSSTPLQTLDLTHNLLQDKGSRGLGEALKVDDTLETLSLAQNKYITYMGIRFLAEGLRENKGLKAFSFKDNIGTGDQGAFILAEALHINRTLEELNMKNTNLHRAGKAALREAEAQHPNLTVLL